MRRRRCGRQTRRCEASAMLPPCARACCSTLPYHPPRPQPSSRKRLTNTAISSCTCSDSKLPTSNTQLLSSFAAWSGPLLRGRAVLPAARAVQAPPVRDASAGAAAARGGAGAAPGRGGRGLHGAPCSVPGHIRRPAPDGWRRLGRCRRRWAAAGERRAGVASVMPPRATCHPASAVSMYGCRGCWPVLRRPRLRRPSHRRLSTTAATALAGAPAAGAAPPPPPATAPPLLQRPQIRSRSRSAGGRRLPQPPKQLRLPQRLRAWAWARARARARVPVWPSARTVRTAMRCTSTGTSAGASTSTASTPSSTG